MADFVGGGSVRWQWDVGVSYELRQYCSTNTCLAGSCAMCLQLAIRLAYHEHGIELLCVVVAACSYARDTHLLHVVMLPRPIVASDVDRDLP